MSVNSLLVNWICVPVGVGRSHRCRARMVLFAIVLGALTACSGNKAATSTTTVSDHRVMGITANPTTPQDATNAVNLAINAGARGAVSTFTWSSLETSPGVYSLQNVKDSISYSTSQGFTIYLGIQLINTVPKETPTDLLSIAWNDPMMESRFHALLDAIRPLLTANVRYISVGNEVDVYLRNNPTEWGAYESFYQDAVKYIHQTMPSIQVGVTTTFTGTSTLSQANVTQLNTTSDVWIFTYYPLGAGFVPNGPQSPLNDVGTMISLAAGRPVVLQEAGYPTSSVISSSEADQAGFITNLFQAWQSHIQQMPFVNYFLLHDLTSTFCANLAAYYNDPNDAALEAYLCSLGLRHTDDTPKVGWSTLASTATAQGFPH